MLLNAPVHERRQFGIGPDALAVYPMSSTEYFRFLAHVVLARNPYINDPPPITPLTPAGAGTPLPANANDAVLTALTSIAIDPMYWRSDALVRMATAAAAATAANPANPSGMPPVQEVMRADDLANVPATILFAIRASLNLGYIPRPRIRLQSDSRYAMILAAMTNLPEETWPLSVLALGLNPGGLTDGNAHTHAAVFGRFELLGGAPRALASGYLRVAKDPDADKDDQAQRANAERARRIAILYEWCATRYFDFAMRRLINFVLEPVNLDYLKFRLVEAGLEDIVTRMRAIVARPTSPWMARALRFYGTAQRETAGGRIATLGLPKHLLPNQQFDQDFFGALINPSGSAVNVVAIYEALRPAVVAYTERLRTWDQNGVLAQLESAVGAVQVGAPLEFNLWGPEDTIYALSPSAANVAVPDIDKLCVSPAVYIVEPSVDGSLPRGYEADDPRGIHVIGQYANGPQVVTGSLPPAIGVELEDKPVIILSDLLGQIPPEFLRYAVPPYYNREPEAEVIPATLPALADYYGVTEATLLSMIAANPASWAHLVTVTNGPNGIEVTFTPPAPECRYLARSPHTAYMQGTATVPVPRLDPGFVVMMKAGRVVHIVPQARRIMRDRRPASPAVDITDQIKAVVDSAVAGIVRK